MFFTPSLLCSTSQCYGSLDASFSFPLAELHRFVESPPCPVGKRSSHMVVSSFVGSPPNSGFEKIAAGKRCRRALLQGSPANDPVDSASKGYSPLREECAQAPSSSQQELPWPAHELGKATASFFEVGQSSTAQNVVDTGKLLDKGKILLVKETLPLFMISDIDEYSKAFSIEGKILNWYGTYRSISPRQKKNARYFKFDIVDADCIDTITVVLVDPFIETYTKELKMGLFIRIDCPLVRAKTITMLGQLCSPCMLVSFVNSRKHDYDRVMAQMAREDIVMFVARNIGLFVGKVHTLSVLDVTTLAPVRGPRLKEELTTTFHRQCEILGYNREVVGTLRLVNFNRALLHSQCSVCDSPKVKKVEGRLCCSLCDKDHVINTTLKLEAQIRSSVDRRVMAVQVSGSMVDCLLGLPTSFKEVYMESIPEARDILSTSVVVGVFKIGTNGSMISFTPLLETYIL
ncbi:hypothetical protein GOP47_0000064 [Adiantum capillus-veneris]|uniref:Uncharacterized protein n=1 Tax=Adiantum capillus-veneris TaxID=13818 RepID=A0A9D4VCB8_ADICA|nr:hypothetical protein GOP47_0000064 [Adiantum capillus-veneris]